MDRVHGTDDVLKLVRDGLRNRAVRSTDLNTESSRSHSILQMVVQVCYEVVRSIRSFAPRPPFVALVLTPIP